MADMLVNLTVLEKYGEDLPDLAQHGINVRRVMSYERANLDAFVKKHFGTGWASEVEMAFAQHPITCFIATHEGCIIGFAAYECTMRDYFGPTGVDPEYRKKGIGRVLLYKCMEALKQMGYAYAIIGGAGPKDFYRKNCGAEVIDGSDPGVYIDGLKPVD